MAVGNVWAAVVKQAKLDLVSPDDRLALLAARYFFFEPRKGDDRDIRTFAGLCAVTSINAEAAAEAIFRKLSPDQKRRICILLKHAGYNVRLRVIA